ncbi:MAG: major capsid protein, partial [Janthinobacterium lividum]
MAVMPPSPSFAYDTTTLIGVVPTLLRPQSFLLDRYFPKVYLSDTETVAIDVQYGKRRMTPFVSPLVEGRVVEQLGRRTRVFEPPYLKDKRVPDLRAPLKRAIGERLLGESTGAEREQLNIIAILQDQVEMLTRREEWMAAQA